MNTETSEYSYLLNGQAVTIVEKLASGGFLVCPIYEDPETGEPMDGENFITPKVWSKPPTEVLNAEVKELEAAIHALSEKRYELEKLVREDRKKWEEVTAKCLKYKALENIFDFVEGKITHYVIDNYSRLEIVPFADAKSEYGSTGEPKLLTLFGKSNRDLQWNLHQYSDGSGHSKYRCFPARSYEEAIEFLTVMANEKFSTEQEYFHGYLIESCDKHGIPVPSDFRENFRKTKMDGLQKQVEAKQVEMDRLKDELETLSLGGITKDIE